MTSKTDNFLHPLNLAAALNGAIVLYNGTSCKILAVNDDGDTCFVQWEADGSAEAMTLPDAGFCMAPLVSSKPNVAPLAFRSQQLGCQFIPTPERIAS